MKSAMGLMPELNMAAMLTRMMGASSTLVGWAVHFMIGTVVWGALFVALNKSIPGGSQLLSGVVFGIGAWVLMIMMAMPMAGAGLFGTNLGMMAPIMTLVLHIIFGAVLGGVYGAERPAIASPA